MAMPLYIEGDGDPGNVLSNHEAQGDKWTVPHSWTTADWSGNQIGRSKERHVTLSASSPPMIESWGLGDAEKFANPHRQKQTLDSHCPTIAEGFDSNGALVEGLIYHAADGGPATVTGKRLGPSVPTEMQQALQITYRDPFNSLWLVSHMPLFP